MKAEASEPIRLRRYASEQTDAFPWGSLTWYANRKLGNSEDMTVGLCRMKPGEGNPRHYHPNCSEILVVIEGKIVHATGETTEAEMGPGDSVTIEPKVWHGARNVGDIDALLFIAFSSADRETVMAGQNR